MTEQQQLTEIRNQIDSIDKQIQDLIGKRAECAQKVADIKTQGGNVDADGQPIPEPIYYLSGILYSDEYRMCTVNLPSGETKIFTEKDKINEKITILSIQENKIKICGVCKGNFKEIKIGEELAL